MTGPANAPIDVMAILTDLQQQVSDLTGVVKAQQNSLRDLTVMVQPQDEPQPPAVPPAPTAGGRPGGA